MVAIITTGYYIRQTLGYNENKVKEGQAECISEGNYLVEVDQLTSAIKLNRFLKQLKLNENITRNTMHVSLNFHPSDQGLTRKVLTQIADQYMEKIGFSEQPYLVYQHHDAAHPHLHLVSIIVGPDGSSINMHKIGVTHSLPACREIEKKHGLIIAKKEKKTRAIQGERTDMRAISYGERPLVRAISTIVKSVLDRYHFTSLLELNAVLRQYNILADRGAESSRFFKRKGLIYRTLDTNGKSIGKYVRASHLHNRATLKFIQARFKENQEKRLPFKSRIQNSINRCLLDGPIPLVTLMKDLGKQGIHMAVDRNDVGILQSIVYVDHQTKSIFDGDDLGKSYNATGIQQRSIVQRNVEHDLRYSPVPEKKISLQAVAEESPHCDYTSDLTRLERRLNPTLVNERAVDTVPDTGKKSHKRKKRLSSRL